MFIANTEFVAYRLLWHAVMGLALTLCMPIAVQYASAQQQIRYPELLEHEGKKFAAYVNEKSGVPYWVIDIDSLDFTLGTSMYLSTESGVENAADAFIEAHAEAFGMTLGQLGEPRITGDDQWWFVSYPQLHGGNRVLDADYGLTVTRGGRLIAAGATGFSSVSVTAPRSLSSSAAIAAAKSHAGVTDVQSEVKSDPIVVPVELEDSYSFRLAWEVTLYNYDTSPPFSKTYIVDANNGTILREYSNFMESGHHILHDDLSLRTTNAALGISVAAKEAQRLDSCPSGIGATHSIGGTIRLNHYESPNASNAGFIRREGVPFSGAKFTVKTSGGNLVCTGYAGEDGAYSVSVDNAGTYIITFMIENDRAKVTQGLRNACESEKSFTLNVNGAARLDYNWGWGHSGDGGMTSYALNGVYQIRRMHNYFNTSFGFMDLDNAEFKLEVYAHPSRLGGTYTSSNTIELGAMNAMSSDITLHEYTHNVLHRINNLNVNAYGDDRHGPAMDEGLSDFFATDVTNDNYYGGPLQCPPPPDDEDCDHLPWVRMSSASSNRFMFNGCTMDLYDQLEGNCGLMRRNNAVVPSPHLRGKIIGGVMWRLRKNIDPNPGGMATRLLFKALNMPPVINSFQDLRDRYERADSGSHTYQIEEKFLQTKIGGPLLPGRPGVSITSSRNPRIRWTDRSLHETGYVVQSKSDTENIWTVVARLGDNVTEHVDTGFKCQGGGSGSQHYRVRANKAYVVETAGSGHMYTKADTLWSYSAPTELDLDTCNATGAMRDHADGSDAASKLVADSTGFMLDALDAYPNPFNPEAVVRYGVWEETQVRIAVFDVLGRQVTVLVDEKRPAGQYEVRFDGNRLPSGAYFVRMTAGAQVRTTMVQLLK